jgi:hypothetical protein
LLVRYAQSRLQRAQDEGGNRVVLCGGGS